MKPIADVLTEMGWPQRLRDIAAGIRQNVPRSSNPEAFHERKSELENQAAILAAEIEQHTAGGQR